MPWSGIPTRLSRAATGGPLAIVFAVALLTAGCAQHVNDVMRGWEGASASGLIASWGPPTRVLSDGAGGRILVYERSDTVASPAQATTTTTGSAIGTSGYTLGQTESTTVYTPPTVNTAYRMFWVNPAGKVYRWAWGGGDGP